MIQHREQVSDEHSCVCPRSPRRHSLRVPCQRRFSLPGDRPWLTNWPRVSTAVLVCPFIYQSPRSIQELTYRIDKWRVMKPRDISCRHGGQADTALSAAKTSWIGRQLSKKYYPNMLMWNDLLTAPESVMSYRNFKKHGSHLLSFVDTSLTAKMR